MQDIDASASPEVQINENFETIDYAAVYGKRQPVTTGLTWGYYGGRWGGYSVADGTVTLTNAATNYLVANRSSGAVSVSTATTNWNDTANYARIYKITTAGSVVTAVEDHRAGLYGAHGPVTAAAGSVGRHSIPVSAAAMRPRVSNGCATLAAVEISASQPNVVTLDFDQTTQEYAQFMVLMPKSWDRGTVTFQPVFSHASGGATFSVTWSLAAVHVANDGAMGVSFGTVQYSQQDGGTANDLYIGPESAPITVSGSPSSNAVIPVFFEISRVTGASSDDLNLDARLHGIMLHINTSAETDA